MPLWRGGPNTRTLPTVLLTPSASKAADMAHLCVPQNQALGVCRGFAPDIQICGTHGRKNLVNATIISNAEEEELTPRTKKKKKKKKSSTRAFMYRNPHVKDRQITHKGSHVQKLSRQGQRNPPQGQSCTETLTSRTKKSPTRAVMYRNPHVKEKEITHKGSHVQKPSRQGQTNHPQGQSCTETLIPGQTEVPIPEHTISITKSIAHPPRQKHPCARTRPSVSVGTRRDVWLVHDGPLVLDHCTSRASAARGRG